MALATSVDENKWILTNQGQRGEIVKTASTVEIIYATWKTVTEEYKYYAITVSAAQSYLAANPTIDLQLELIPNFPTACNIVKRSETTTFVGVTSQPPTPPPS